MTIPQPSRPGSPQAARGRRWPLASVGGALAVLAAVSLGLYEMDRSTGKHASHAGACAGSLDLASTVDRLVRGDVAALTLAASPNPLGDVAFDKADGTRTSVGAFAGRTVLLNLWATWCVPCRAEMPSLDKLQAQLGSPRFAVVPIDVDTNRLDRARGFFAEIGATSLPYYADNSADILQKIGRSEKIVGLPTTIIIGADGCEIGTMAGPANWESPDAKALIERLTAPAPAAKT